MDTTTSVETPPFVGAPTPWQLQPDSTVDSPAEFSGGGPPDDART